MTARASARRGLLVEQVLGAITQPPGLEEHDQRGRAEQIGQQALLGSQPRKPRLHPVERLTLLDALPLRGTPRMLGDERARRVRTSAVGRISRAGKIVTAAHSTVAR